MSQDSTEIRGDDEAGRLSRSQRKRDHKALQALVRDLVAAPRATLDTLPIPDELKASLDAAKKLVPKALNREIRHLARQLDIVDPGLLQAALNKYRQPYRSEINALHRAERMRDRLLGGDVGALAELIERHPEVDRQHVRQLLRAAMREAARDDAPKSARKLFKILHAIESSNP